MRKIVKKGMALASATIMIAGSMPMTAVSISANENDENQIAVQAEQDTEIQAEQDIAVQADSETASGTWGTCEWTYDNGTLTIGGGVGFSIGDDYTSRPWNNYVSNIEKVVITDKIIFAPDTSLNGFFAEMTELKSIDGLSNLDTSNVIYMGYMFKDCNSLISLDLSHFNTSNVTGMQLMFSGCESLTSLDLSHFDTANVTSMLGMFQKNQSLKKLDISGFDTSSVTNMNAMFNQARSLESLDLSNFNTCKVTNMGHMFANCSNLKELNIGSFDTSNITSMRCLFLNCASLTTLDISNFNTSNVSNMYGVFWGCINLMVLDLRNFNTDKVTNMWNMFADCKSLTSLDVSSFNTSSVTDMNAMFYGAQCLGSLDLSNFDTANVTNMNKMFSDCSNLKELNISSFETSNVKYMVGIFSGCKNLHELDISSFDVSNVSPGADNILGYSFENKVVKIKVPHKMPSKFAERIKASIVRGTWKDETSGITYYDKDSMDIEEEHTYVFCPAELKASLAIKNNDMDNKKITLNATAKGGLSGYTYQFIMRNMTDGSWSVIQDYSNANTCIWNMVGTGKRNFYVNVKDSLGKVVRSEAVTTELPRDESGTIADVVKNNNLGYTVNKDSSGTQLLTGVKTALKADSFKTGFGANITVKSADGTELADNAAVGTGCILELIQDKRIVDTATVVVKGDTDGNGSIDVLDMEAIQKSILGIGDKLSGAYKEAASLTDSDDITVLDMEAIQKDILGIQKIN